MAGRGGQRYFGYGDLCLGGRGGRQTYRGQQGFYGRRAGCRGAGAQAAMPAGFFFSPDGLEMPAPEPYPRD
ncbi:hypothetical protein ACP4OV_004984 [Aristida adscensionis]